MRFFVTECGNRHLFIHDFIISHSAVFGTFFCAVLPKLNKQKNEEILAIKQNTELVHEMDAQIGTILSETSEVRNKLNEMYLKAVSLFGTDYLSLNNEQKYLLGALVNNTKALAALFGKMIGVEDGEESE